VYWSRRQSKINNVYICSCFVKNFIFKTTFLRRLGGASVHLGHSVYAKKNVKRHESALIEWKKNRLNHSSYSINDIWLNVCSFCIIFKYFKIFRSYIFLYLTMNLNGNFQAETSFQFKSFNELLQQANKTKSYRIKVLDFQKPGQ
jgi:hypothetical protein